MTISSIFSWIGEALWKLGGIGAAADLGLDGFGSGGYDPCPRESANPCCAPLEAATCRMPCSNSSSTRLSR